MKRLCIGILAHVDAGKTTLSESLLYTSGSIRKLGRVDKKDAFLDTDKQEKERGITIFSKQARFCYKDTEIILVDTPGHVDFAAEMERTLQVLDYAILVISGSDGVQGHTLTLWKLLKRYQIPTFVFINKMDQSGTDKKAIMQQLRKQLSEGCVDFSQQATEPFFESIAMCDETVLNTYLSEGAISSKAIAFLIKERKLFPCFFGSALRLQGADELLKALDHFTIMKAYETEFGARIFKITRDEAGNRLTHVKITGGCLHARDSILDEKVNQIRIYSGCKYETVDEVQAGTVCAVTGLTKTQAGEGLGYESGLLSPILEPVLSYSILLPDGYDAALMLPKLRQLEEEEPQLHITWDEKNRILRAQIMGQVQMEILAGLIKERFGIDVEFGPGKVLYKETITGKAWGAGHFEPLRHYAEVYLLLEAGEPGSGLHFATDCSEDILERNWQRLVLTHLEEKEHCGVLIGAPITDMKITLKMGRAHNKHTEGGDFRQATYRAVRQGLMEAESILLEPWYQFRLEVPQACIGRAMTDVEKMSGSFELSHNTEKTSVLTGYVPMAEVQNYAKEVMTYTKGKGQLFCSLKGYYPCHNAQQVIEQAQYYPEQDIENTPDSVFCAHGAGFIVPWMQVPDYMHTQVDKTSNETEACENIAMQYKALSPDYEKSRFLSNLGQEEIESILSKTAYANQRQAKTAGRAGWKREKGERTIRTDGSQTVKVYNPMKRKEKYLLVDGYNVIYAWRELKELAEINLDGARGRLLDILCNYQAIRGCHLVVVFDAYKVAGHAVETQEYHNIHVVFTAQAQTADCYIERFVHENSKKYDVTVATSDGLEQIIIVGEGCKLISSRELETEIERASQQLREDYL